LGDLRPHCVVLVHGPSDVSLINQREAAAAAAHCGVAGVVARSGKPAVLVSTDNVFAGRRGGYLPDDPVLPCNGYGRIKARAERLLLAGGLGLVIRVSLVYGWVESGHRTTFAQRCLEAALAGRPMAAPMDQMFTPIHVRDVATALAAVCKSAVPPTGVQHLAGPQELSRYEFARLAYGLVGSDPHLVRPCRRRETEWASRPRFSSLAMSADRALPVPNGWYPMSPAEGLRDMLAEGPGRQMTRGAPHSHRAGGSFPAAGRTG
jgi:dTDP-4-dehydrorhamnose reductase